MVSVHHTTYNVPHGGLGWCQCTTPLTVSHKHSVQRNCCQEQIGCTLGKHEKYYYFPCLIRLCALPRRVITVVQFKPLNIHRERIQNILKKKLLGASQYFFFKDKFTVKDPEKICIFKKTRNSIKTEGGRGGGGGGRNTIRFILS